MYLQTHMRRFFFVSLLLTSLWLPSLTSAQASWRDSLEVLQRELRLHPNDVQLRLRKAAVNIELGQWDYAIEEYGRVLDSQRTNPTSPTRLTALFFRAFAYVQLRQLPLAAADYETILQYRPSHFEARLGLAEVRRVQGQRDKTLDQMNLLVQQHPDSATAWAMRAQYEEEIAAEEQKGNAKKKKKEAEAWMEAAEYDWQEAVRLAPRRHDFAAALNRLLNKRNRAD